MKRKHEKKVEKAIITQILFRIQDGWRTDYNDTSCYMLSADSCCDVIDNFIRPNLKGWKRFEKLNTRDWNTLSEDDVLFMDNAFGDEDWDTFAACHERALRKLAKHISALL